MCDVNLALTLYHLSTLKKIWLQANNTFTNKQQETPVEFELYKATFDILGLSLTQAHQLQFQHAHDYDSFIDAIVTIAQPSNEK
ncbi:hypothetical protein [Pseudoalteromonas piscicida]|nr:hypothetical protein [Pseudoalteromonas piscicida]